MAWDDHEYGGVWLLSGDTPFDVLGGAVKRLHKDFLERWGRPPYLAELLYTLVRYVDLHPNRPVADETLPSLEALMAFVGGLTAAEHIDPGDYEAASDGESDDFLILLRNSNGREKMAARCEVLQLSGVEIICRYETVLPTITDRMAHCLIRYCVLDGLLDIDLTDRNLSIQFERRPPCDPT